MLATVFAKISNCLSILCHCMWTFGTFCQLLVKYQANLLTQFYKLGKSKRTLATCLTTICKGLRLFYKRLRLFCKCLWLFCKRLATICGKINSKQILNMFKISLRQEKLFATIKTVCELVCNLLRTLTKSWWIQNSLRSQAFAAQCDTPFSFPFWVGGGLGE